MNLEFAKSDAMKVAGAVPPLQIAVVSNTTWYLYNFRLTLMRALIAAGHEVTAIGPLDAYAEKLVAAGIRHRAIPLAGASVNPLLELESMFALYRLLRDERTDVVLSFTPKGNIYGALAAAVIGISTVPNISGLGRVFIRRTPLTWLVKRLYRFTLRRASRVFFQNQADMDAFMRLGLVDIRKAEQLPGSGVDLKRFFPRESTAIESSFSFLLVGRLLWDKGVGEFVEAARKVRQEVPKAHFSLLGFLNVQNPSAVSSAQVAAWETEGVVRYLGATDDVEPFLRKADCVVLPSYREGCPRTLLEAAAMGKPVITTDAPGCRDTIDDGVTGFLCRVKDADDLAAQMLRLLRLSESQRRTMGMLGREKMLREFDEKIVIERYLSVVQQNGARR